MQRAQNSTNWSSKFRKLSFIARRFLQFLSQEPIGPKFAESIRRGIAQADNGQSIVCDGYAEMVEKLLGEE
jgi:hypothetical protein